MSDSLDSILSRGGAAMPQTEQPPTQETTPPAPTEQSAEPAAETPTAEQEPGTDGQTTVPVAALHAERQKVKRYTEQIASFEQKLNESNAQWERRINQLLERIPQQQQQRPDFFADPDAAVQQAISPVLQHINNMREENSRNIAEIRHGEETVTAAFQAMEQGMQSDPAVRGEYQRIMNSRDPWGELVRWHKRNSALQEIGDDPAAYKERIKAEIQAELQQGNSQQPAQQRPGVMPSNLAGARNVGSRSGPAWGGPPSIGSIFDMKRKTGT